MLDIRLDFDDVLGFEAWINDAVTAQIPFATALALTWTAKDARKALVGGLSEHFTIRSRWTAGSIRFQGATKSRPVAEIGSVAPYMELQAKGGTKVPQKGKQVGVPQPLLRSEATRGIVRARGKHSPKRLLTKRLRKAGNFVKPLSAGSTGLFRKRNDGSLEMLYVMAPRVSVSPGWPFQATVEDVVRERWPINARKALRYALRGARKRRR